MLIKWDNIFMPSSYKEGIYRYSFVSFKAAVGKYTQLMPIVCKHVVRKYSKSKDTNDIIYNLQNSKLAKVAFIEKPYRLSKFKDWEIAQYLEVAAMRDFRAYTEYGISTLDHYLFESFLPKDIEKNRALKLHEGKIYFYLEHRDMFPKE